MLWSSLESIIVACFSLWKPGECLKGFLKKKKKELSPNSRVIVISRPFCKRTWHCSFWIEEIAKVLSPFLSHVFYIDFSYWWEDEWINTTHYNICNKCFCFSDDSSMKEKPAEKSKEKKVVKPVRKVQKVAQLSSSECKTGWFSQY